MDNQISAVTRVRAESILQTNSVIRNTYILLGTSLLFSGVMAAVAMHFNAKPMGLLSLLVYFGLFFFINAMRNSALGIVGVFALTGFMGYTLGPILNMYLQYYVNGSQLIMTALGGTGIIFFGLSGYALTTRKDFSYMGGMIMAGSIVLLLAVLVQIFYPMPMLQLIISGAFMLFSSAMILFETSRIINGGETNYVMATVSIFVSIYNLFISLLQLLSFFGGQRDYKSSPEIQIKRAAVAALFLCVFIFLDASLRWHDKGQSPLSLHIIDNLHRSIHSSLIDIPQTVRILCH
jgi:modulator of FtsH protease